MKVLSVWNKELEPFLGPKGFNTMPYTTVNTQVEQNVLLEAQNIPAHRKAEQGFVDKTFAGHC
jgi:hypothetical protein